MPCVRVSNFMFHMSRACCICTCLQVPLCFACVYGAYVHKYLHAAKQRSNASASSRCFAACVNAQGIQQKGERACVRATVGVTRV